MSASEPIPQELRCRCERHLGRVAPLHAGIARNCALVALISGPTRNVAFMNVLCDQDFSIALVGADPFDLMTFLPFWTFAVKDVCPVRAHRRTGVGKHMVDPGVTC